MLEMLESSDWEFKITMINILRTAMDKVNSIQEQRITVSKEI